MTRDNRAWDDWLAALADPRRRLRIVVCRRRGFAAWDLGRRILDDHMLHWVQRGGHVGSVAGVPVRTAAGDLLWVPPGAAQELRCAPGGLAKCWLRFRLDGAVWPRGEPPVRGGLDIGHLMAQLLAEHRARLPGWEAVFRATLVQVFAAWRRAGSERKGALSLAQRERLLALVDRRPGVGLTPAALARALRLSPAWFARRFRATFGAAPRTWLLQHRMRVAAQWLAEGDEPVGAVAAALGYRAPHVFSRQFRAVLGLSPRRWCATRRDGR